MGGKHQLLLHKLLETHQMVVISAVGPELGFNCRLKEKLIADILSLIKNPCTRKMSKCISQTQAASYLVRVKVCEVCRRKFSKHCEGTDFKFIVPIKLRSLHNCSSVSQ